VGAAAGAAHGAAYDPDYAYAFGLQRVLDSLGALIDTSGARPATFTRHDTPNAYEPLATRPSCCVMPGMHQTSSGQSPVGPSCVNPLAVQTFVWLIKQPNQRGRGP
jgi:hypothetical protein